MGSLDRKGEHLASTEPGPQDSGRLQLRVRARGSPRTRAWGRIRLTQGFDGALGRLLVLGAAAGDQRGDGEGVGSRGQLGLGRRRELHSLRGRRAGRPASQRGDAARLELGVRGAKTDSELSAPCHSPATLDASGKLPGTPGTAGRATGHPSWASAEGSLEVPLQTGTRCWEATGRSWHAGRSSGTLSRAKEAPRLNLLVAATPGARSHSAAPHVTASWGRVRKAGPPDPPRLAGWVPRAPPPPGPARSARDGELQEAVCALLAGLGTPTTVRPEAGEASSVAVAPRNLSFLSACTRDAPGTADRSWGPQRRRGSGADGPGASKGRRRVRFPRSSAGRLGDGAGEAGGSCVMERSEPRPAAGFPTP